MTPDGFPYGVEYTQDMINQILESERNKEASAPEVLNRVITESERNKEANARRLNNTSTSEFGRDELGHGTAIAAAAADVVPDAELLVVKLKTAKPYLKEYYRIPESAVAYQENDIMLGISYIEKYARRVGRPVVICIGVGTNQGNHNGSAPLPRYLGQIAEKRGVAVVIGGGNEGNKEHHYRGELGDFLQGRGELYDNVEIQVAEDCTGFALELWGNVPDVFSVSVRTPGGEQTPDIRYSLGNRYEHTFVYEKSRVSIESQLSESFSGEELILLRFFNPTPGIWTVNVLREENGGNGIFHMWLPMDGFLDVPVRFLMPDPYTTITEPGMAAVPLVVSSYDSSNDSFYLASGRGYTRDGNINPQLASPGVGIEVGREAWTGGGMAAAITAGAVAQFIQWAIVEGNFPLVESRELKSLFIRGAVREDELRYPNREWGYGTMNIAGVFEVLAGI